MIIDLFKRIEHNDKNGEVETMRKQGSLFNKKKEDKNEKTSNVQFRLKPKKNLKSGLDKRISIPIVGKIEDKKGKNNNKNTCIRCGKQLGLTGNTKLIDGYLCKDCSKEFKSTFKSTKTNTAEFKYVEISELKRAKETQEKNRQNTSMGALVALLRCCLVFGALGSSGKSNKASLSTNSQTVTSQSSNSNQVTRSTSSSQRSSASFKSSQTSATEVGKTESIERDSDTISNLESEASFVEPRSSEVEKAKEVELWGAISPFEGIVYSTGKRFVYAGAYTNQKILGYVSFGEEITLTGKCIDKDGDPWYRIDYHGEDGYISGYYVQAAKPVSDNKAQNNTVDNGNEELVWISASGKKYHSNSSCSNMKNPWQVTVTEAERLGKTPCKKCYGS